MECPGRRLLLRVSLRQCTTYVYTIIPRVTYLCNDHSQSGFGSLAAWYSAYSTGFGVWPVLCARLAGQRAEQWAASARLDFRGYLATSAVVENHVRRHCRLVRPHYGRELALCPRVS